MSNIAAVAAEALTPLTAPIDAGLLMEKSFEDGIPLTNHQARAIEILSIETVSKGGFYTLVNQPDGQGSVFSFYNLDGEVKHTVQLNFPNVSKERKIPRRAWLVDLFGLIGYPSDRIEIKWMFRILDSHVRDGGSWTSSVSADSIHFVLRMNDRVKSRFDFHKEDLTK